MRVLSVFNRVLLVVMLMSGVSMASPLDGLKKVGEAKLRVYFWDVYNSSLYSSTGEYQPKLYPLALNINYLRDIDAEDLIQSTKDEWQKLGIKSAQSVQWLNLLKGIFPNIKKGDSLLLHVNQSKQSEFYFNNQSIGVIEDVEFGNSFLRIWLDKNASYPKVRNKLLGSTQ